MSKNKDFSAKSDSALCVSLLVQQSHLRRQNRDPDIAADVQDGQVDQLVDRHRHVVDLVVVNIQHA